MSAALHPRFASPLTLLHDWLDSGRMLDDALFLGFTVDLPFLEKVAIPLVRNLGARAAVIGDAAQTLYEPVDVRTAGRSYLHGLASCGGAFHPKVVLLMGEESTVLAVGSGNPTLSGWGTNDELWTVVEVNDGSSHAVLADLADWLGDLPSVVALAPWSADRLRETAALLTERHNSAPPVATDGPRLLHNLRHGLLQQLTPPERGGVDELHAYAPFIDPGGEALRSLTELLTPRQIVLGVQPRWSSYDAATVRSELAGAAAQIRLLEEARIRHGKFVQWRAGDRWYALTGSPNLTRAALTRSTADGGNCELAVFTPESPPLLPDEGHAVPLADFAGRTVRPFRSEGTALVLLGVKTDSEALYVSLARAQRDPVVISTSPDASPGSWTETGTVPIGRKNATFPLPAAPGTAVRAAFEDGSAESAVVFVYSPVHSARRSGADSEPQVRYDYTAEALFGSDTAARRFEADLERLREFSAENRAPQVSAAVRVPSAQTGASADSGADRWDAYVASCRRMIGDPLTVLAFGALPVAPRGAATAGWVVSTLGDTDTETDADEADADAEEEDPVGSAARSAPSVDEEFRAHCRRWIPRWIKALTAADRTVGPVPPRLVVASLMVQLLAAGIWDEEDDSWRTDLHDLLVALGPGAHEPAEAEQTLPQEERRRRAVAAVLMTLLGEGATFTGGGEHDVVAARAWHNVRTVVAKADPDDASDLMLLPEKPRAHVASWSDVADLVSLARNDDPHAEVVRELTAAGWSVAREDELWEITGSFSNPVPVAAKVADRLGRRSPGGVLVLARGRNGRWAFVAWSRPHLILLNSPTRAWSTYLVRPPTTPESRFSSGDLSSVPGLVGGRTQLGAGPPPVLRDVLAESGVTYSELIRRLFP